LTDAVPAVVIRLAGTAALTCVVLTKVVVRDVPLNVTTVAGE